MFALLKLAYKKFQVELLTLLNKNSDNTTQKTLQLKLFYMFFEYLLPVLHDYSIVVRMNNYELLSTYQKHLFFICLHYKCHLYSHALLLNLVRNSHYLLTGHPFGELLRNHCSSLNEEDGEISLSCLTRSSQTSPLKESLENMSKNYVRVGMMQNLGKEFASEFGMVQKKKYHYYVSELTDAPKINTLVEHFRGVLKAIEDGTWLHYKPVKDRKVLIQEPSVCTKIDPAAVIDIHDFEEKLADRVQKSNSRMPKNQGRRRRSSLQPSEGVADSDDDDDDDDDDDQQNLWDPLSSEEDEVDDHTPNPDHKDLYVIKILSVKMRGVMEFFTTKLAHRLTGEEKILDLQDWEIYDLDGDEEMALFHRNFM
jgi:hypothetical protein